MKTKKNDNIPFLLLVVGIILLGVGFFSVSLFTEFSKTYGEDELTLMSEEGRYFITNGVDINFVIDHDVYLKYKAIEYIAYFGFIFGAISIWIFIAKFMVYRVKHRNNFR